MQETLITPKEAAELKDVSPRTVYKAISEGKLPHIIQLGRFALRKMDVEAWQPGTRGGAYNTKPMSDSAKEKLSESQRRRWAELRSRD